MGKYQPAVICTFSYRIRVKRMTRKYVNRLELYNDFMVRYLNAIYNRIVKIQ